MNQNLLRLFFGIYFCIILGVLLFPVGQSYWVVSGGAVYEFAVEGYDPYDFFRGRYISFRLQNAEIDDTSEIHSKNDLPSVFYVPICPGNNGPSTLDFSRIYESVPEGIACMPMKYSYSQYELCFDRYYLNEQDAIAAEKMLEDGSCLARIYVRNGHAVLDGIYYKGKKL